MTTRPEWSREGRDWPNRDASRFVRAGGLRWHVQVAGQGPTILLLHGTGAATHSWRDVLPLLAKDFTVVAPDLPGHGFTDPLPARSQPLPAMATALAALAAELALPPAVVVGHSAGAAVACRVVLDGGLAPRAIVSLNGALLPFPGVAATLFPQAAKLLFDNAVAPRLFALQAHLPGQVERFLARATGSKIDAAGAEFYRRLFKSPAHCAGALGMMADWDLATLARDLPRLGVPLVLAYGDRDAAVPPSVAREVAAKVPWPELVPMPGLGHLAHEERPDLAATIITEAARRHSPKVGAPR